jgi:hypothetical protein
VAKFDIDVTELDDYAIRLRQISGAGALAFTSISQKYRDLTMAEAKRIHAPHIKTGELVRSIQKDTSEASKVGISAGWKVTARHAAPIEYGFVHYRSGKFVGPFPYVRPALKKYRRPYMEELAAAAKQQFRTTFKVSRPQLGSVPSLVNTTRHPNA